ncbi:uncharacterized protein LOC123292935 [Chrysoperla carnea]|uniref:uncharacterized protein LOC123292935 n=1 Tax=Chrysoperla carnea TaxID=189513 RepID=UPI001D0725F8|nr:uncharacterized protein LOC123292935 [Chrysoperla carnea]
MATEQQLRVLTAKKENLFRRIQGIYDASNNIATSENLPLSKLDPETSRLFENYKRKDSIPNYEDIIEVTIPQTGPIAVESKSPPKENHSLESISPSHSLCSTTSCNSPQQNSTVLLATAIVYIQDCNGEKQQARFILDSASQAHLLTANCRKRLGLPMSKVYNSISGIGSNSNPAHGQSNLTFFSRYDPLKSYNINVLVVNKITNQLPTSPINTESMSCFKNLPLADEKYHQPGPIDGIIGAQLFPHLFYTGRVTTSKSSPIAVESSLGYVVMGCAPLLSSTDQTQIFCTTMDEPPIENILKRFWELEEVSVSVAMDPEDEYCENLFVSTVDRDPTGRYIVSLPFKNHPSNLGDSYSFAYKRYLSLERRLKASPELKLEYDKIIQDYLNQGHMSIVEENDSDSTTYYIPHHPIFKASSSTPVRAVFDASMKSTSSLSLNDILYAGPKLQIDIRTILLNFRLFSIAMCADIRQMYRQIIVAESHRRYQRLLWRFSPERLVTKLQLNTVSFGIKSSPYLALRVVQQLAKDESKTYPNAAQVVLRDLYIDDLVSSVDSIDDAKLLYEESVGLFKSGGFELVKWSSNSKQLLDIIPPEIHLVDLLQFESDTLKVLGLQWNPHADILSFQVNSTRQTCSKRIILSTIARCYDPLGLLSPVILYAKLIIKDLWSLALQWDDTPPPNILKKWLLFIDELSLLNNFQVPRHVSVFKNSPTILVAFADASEKAYGGVVYLQTLTPNKQIKVTLLCSKSKVSPTKTISIPRLELCAAHLVSKLVHFVLDTYGSRIPIIDLLAFSDSTVVLSWLNSSPSRWATFVANRVTKVTQLVSKENWFHIDSQSNPADCISRGLTPSELLEHPLWLTGPSWLSNYRNQWPIQPFDSGVSSTTIEQKLIALPLVDKGANSLYLLVTRISTWWKLIRATIYVLRFLRILPRQNYILAEQLEKAELTMIRVVQRNLMV